MSESQAMGLAQHAPGSGPAVEDLGQQPVAVLSSAVLRAARRGRDEDQAGFADRAGVPVDVISGAEDGTRPAWALPYDEFTAIASALAASCFRMLFETAAACDLLLSSVLDGDQALATDVLAESGSGDLARTLLRLAIAGQSDDLFLAAEDVRLPEHLIALLRERAAALAESGVPDAWVGAEILACLGGTNG